MDLANITLTGLVAIGAVNVLLMFRPNVDSKYKFIVSFIAALAVTFVPADLGTMLLDHLKTAIEVALAASGFYKLAQKVGGQ